MKKCKNASKTPSTDQLWQAKIGSVHLAESVFGDAVASGNPAAIGHAKLTLLSSVADLRTWFHARLRAVRDGLATKEGTRR